MLNKHFLKCRKPREISSTLAVVGHMWARQHCPSPRPRRLDLLSAHDHRSWPEPVVWELSHVSFFFFWTRVWTQGLRIARQVFYHLVTLSALFCVRFFQNRVSGISCLGWLLTMTLLIPASWIARIAGMNLPCPAVCMSWWKGLPTSSTPARRHSPVPCPANHPRSLSQAGAQSFCFLKL
jgi:hypothetical protein